MTSSEKLLQWYAKHGRILPWRRTRDAYPILVSEVMLQQTNVSRVIRFYERWLKEFPDWRSLARAKTDAIIHAWSGLGYNRRALMLRSIAQYVTLHGEPKTETAWQTLKGIGPYTAAAMAAFSLHKRTLPIDTNIRRVLGRVFLGKTFPTRSDDGHIQQAAETLLPLKGKYYDIPQALFDLATIICTKSPHCANCPLRTSCKSAPAFLQGHVMIPKRTDKHRQEKKQTGKKYPDRIYRGRILKEIKTSARGLTLIHIARKIDPSFQKKQDAAWVQAMLMRLTREGFLERRENRWMIAP